MPGVGSLDTAAPAQPLPCRGLVCKSSDNQVLGLGLGMMLGLVGGGFAVMMLNLQGM